MTEMTPRDCDRSVDDDVRLVDKRTIVDWLQMEDEIEFEPARPDSA